MTKIVVCLISLLGMANSASAQQLLRDSDRMHIYLAEVVNVAPVKKVAAFTLDLCAAPKTNAERAECVMLFETTPVEVDGKPEGERFFRLSPRTNSGPLQGPKLNEIAKTLAARIKLKPEQLDFRLAASLFEVDAKNTKTLIERQFSQLPDLNMAPDENKRIQNRHQFEQSKVLKGRILVVISREK